jgi:hypothetical protein
MGFRCLGEPVVNRSDEGCRLPAFNEVRMDEAWIMDRLDTLWPVHNRGFADLLIVLRREFDGDLDAMLILLIVAVGATSENWGLSLLGSADSVIQRSVNSTSLAEITGIPRESVRRKARKLAERGLLTNNDNGEWLLAPDTGRLLSAGTAATIEYLCRILGAAVKAGQ